jgi:pimeloyl-ACP methyl ester carboxylesterase
VVSTAVHETAIPVAGATLSATISGPGSDKGFIVFAHGSGSSRHSPRNRAVAARLNEAGFETVLLDLLTPEEEQVDVHTAQWRFDIELLAGRLVGVCDWIGATHPIGLFGASTGAAAALWAAAERPEAVRAVVSRGGRPDLAGAQLRAVKAPTLLIVGGEDNVVIDLNRQAAAALGPLARLVIVPGATHLFTEPGALERVCEYAVGWFERYLGSSGP